MSVRICYLERGDRGQSLRRVRLVGQTTEAIFPAQASDTALAPADAARWIKDQLDQLRDTESLSVLCMDTEGSACTWVSSPSTDADVVNVVARNGAAGSGGDDGPRGNAAVDFYAAASIDSSVQALAATDSEGADNTRRSRKKGPAAPAETAKRLPIVAITDVPARLLIDALDECGIAVEASQTLWHTAAAAWDPSWSPRAADASPNSPLQAKVVPGVCATVVVDPKGRIIWCWSRNSALLLGGAMRLRMAAPVVAGGEDDASATSSEPARPVFGAEEVHRLTTEWLSWSVQTGHAPSHVVCVVTDDAPEQVSEFGQALGRLWPNSTVDAVMFADPIGATLSRAAGRIEQTPRGEPSLPAPMTMLVGLSRRPGREHRKLFVWSALAISGLALLAGVASVRLSKLADQARILAAESAGRSAALVKDSFPEARVGPGYSLLKATTDEVARLRNLAEPPKRAEPPMPLLEELEAISLVTGNSNYGLESIDLESSSSAVLKLSIVANSLSEFEAMTEALNSIKGSNVIRWEEPSTPDTNSRPGKFKVNYTARWAPLAERKTENR